MLMFALASCSGEHRRDTTPAGAKPDGLSAAHAYSDCLKGAANLIEKPDLSPAQISNLAKARCLTERDRLATALILEITQNGQLKCGDREANVPCKLRDSYEAKFLKRIEVGIAKRRGLPVEPELLY